MRQADLFIGGESLAPFQRCIYGLHYDPFTYLGRTALIRQSSPPIGLFPISPAAPAAAAQASHDDLLKKLKEIFQQASRPAVGDANPGQSQSSIPAIFEEMLQQSPAINKVQALLANLENQVEAVNAFLQQTSKQQEHGFSMLKKYTLASGAGTPPAESSCSDLTSAGYVLPPCSSASDATSSADKDLITLAGHEAFMRMLDLKDTTGSRKVKPTGSDTVPLTIWWVAVFRLRPVASWKNLLVKEAAVNDDQLDEVTSCETLLTFLYDNDVLTTVSSMSVGIGG